MLDKGGIVGAALGWLEGQQQQDGSFIGEASVSKQPFKASRFHETSFFTSLILIALDGLEVSDELSGKALDFLQQERSSIGSWNYWSRKGDMARQYPFPDDLDDTACALLALTTRNPGSVDGQAMAKLAKLLIANETKPGGPYRTWLVSKNLYEEWGDIDIAVNANVGALLARHGVKLPGLEAYVGRQIVAGKLESKYYVGSVPAIYFLSRWYKGAKKDHLKKLSTAELRRLINKPSAMDLAMTLTAACRLGVAAKDIEAGIKVLMSLRVGDHWLAEALYKEITIKKQLYYAGSAALSTALALEALHESNKLNPTIADRRLTAKADPATYKYLMDEARQLPPALRVDYVRIAKAINVGDSKHQITDMAGITARAYGKKLAPDVTRHLNLASLNGWVAYSIYDDFYDEEALPASLAVANHALRQTVAHYTLALPKNAHFAELVGQTLDKMDAANQWEVVNARGRIENGLLRFELPSYGGLNKLAERSQGHMLSAMGTLLAIGYEPGGPQSINLQKFFYHFLIARQLNDDAHDWQEDMTRGQLSFVVTKLLESSHEPGGSVDLAADLDSLKTRFWQTTIHQVAELVLRHINVARSSLAKAGMVDPVTFANWLDDIEKATQKALDGSLETQKFIHAYKEV